MADTTPAADAAASADTAAPAYDSTKFVLGRLCPKGHAYGTTGLTLRRRHNQSCVTCATEQQRERRAAQREGRGVTLPATTGDSPHLPAPAPPPRRPPAP